jgi:hypothetical protein
LNGLEEDLQIRAIKCILSLAVVDDKSLGSREACEGLQEGGAIPAAVNADFSEDAVLVEVEPLATDEDYRSEATSIDKGEDELE